MKFMRRTRKKLFKLLANLGVFLLVAVWLLAGWPAISYINFPPKIKEAYAAPAKIIIADTADGSTVTVAPESGRVEAGRFSLDITKNVAEITSITITFPASVVAGIASVNIWNTADTTEYLSATSPTGDDFVLTTGTALPVSTTLTEFYIWITPKTQGNMAVPNGVTYAATAVVTAAVSAQAFDPITDATDQTVTIDNLSPNPATITSGSVSGEEVTINWTTSSSSDATQSIVLRWVGTSTGGEVPVEGKTDYALDETISTATVACLETNSPSTAASGVDGGASADGCSTTALAGGTDYSYKHFERDTNGNWDTGTDNGSNYFTTAAALSYEQNDFEWFIPEGTVTLTDAWPTGGIDIPENTPLLQIPATFLPLDSGDQVRLQMNFTVTGTLLAAATEDFQLEYDADTDCTTASGWEDVGAKASGEIWRFYAQGTITDGDTQVNQILSSDATAEGDYSESNPSQTNPNQIEINDNSEWDWAIENNGAVENTTYCFRMVIEDGGSGTPFGSYIADSYPKLTTAPGMGDLMRHGNIFSDDGEQGFYWAN
jgi:hypothetical protein